MFDELRQGVGEIEFMANPRVGEVRVGCPETLAATLLPPVVKRLANQYPGIRLYVAQTNPIALDVRQLLDRNVDLLLGRIGPVFSEEHLNAEISTTIHWSSSPACEASGHAAGRLSWRS